MIKQGLKNMSFRNFAKENIVILDGAMGSLLNNYGIAPGELPETWNYLHPEIIEKIHLDYFNAGSNVVNTNTFGANLLKFSEEELDKIVFSAVENANNARNKSTNCKEKFVSLDIGPLGRLLKPFGDLDFEEAYNSFLCMAKLGVKYGVDLITVETMNDSLETKAALLAVKSACDLPVIVTNAYGSDGKLLSGASACVMASMLESLGADYIGANCSLGPDALLGVISELSEYSSLPLVLKPNAGLPDIVNGETVYNISPSDFADSVAGAVSIGASIIGGCCGTSPEYIRALAEITKDMSPVARKRCEKTVITSYCKAVEFDDSLTLIGECINPTGKKRIKLALSEKDVDYIVNLGVSQEECGADALDVNVGMPGICEKDMLKDIVFALQYSVALPLVIDTSDYDAMENALRIYNGKPMINSVNGKRESMEKIFPLMKKYGGTAIALTLDENGIPDTAEERVRIAKRILSVAEAYGIDKKDIVFDPLAMTVSTNKDNARITLEAIRRIRYELGCKTSLGVSNISFGLPKRENINSSFLGMAFSAGLSAAIMNPLSDVMMRSFLSARALLGYDSDFEDYIRICELQDSDTQSAKSSVLPNSFDLTLSSAIEKGLSDSAALITERLLSEMEPMDIVNNEIIPALDKVGAGFEAGKVYLPTLLKSAESAKCAFEKIKLSLAKTTDSSAGKVVIATVKGDIHDIGKNIVKLLLENYGFSVIDLGKDVDADKIADAAVKYEVDIIALSALMTTTVAAMEETIKVLRRAWPNGKIMVGGAVLTEEHASKIGADAYAKDAMGAVRCAEKMLRKKKENDI